MRERNVCHEGDSFIYLHSHHTVGLPLSNKSVEKIRWTLEIPLQMLFYVRASNRTLYKLRLKVSFLPVRGCSKGWEDKIH